MNLTPEGARAAQLGGPEKLQLAGRLVRGEEDINRYVRGFVMMRPLLLNSF